jgi:hypothetical protein
VAVRIRRERTREAGFRRNAYAIACGSKEFLTPPFPFPPPEESRGGRVPPTPPKPGGSPHKRGCRPPCASPRWLLPLGGLDLAPTASGSRHSRAVPLRSLPYKHIGHDVFCAKAIFYWCSSDLRYHRYGRKSNFATEPQQLALRRDPLAAPIGRVSHIFCPPARRAAFSAFARSPLPNVGDFPEDRCRGSTTY